jgi:hypothetical protein
VVGTRLGEAITLQEGFFPTAPSQQHPQHEGTPAVNDTPTPGPQPGQGPERPSYAEENAMRIASESLTHYDQDTDTFHCSYGPLTPAATVHDPERGVLVRVDPETGQVLGFTIPGFREWYAEHAADDGEFEVDRFGRFTPSRNRAEPTPTSLHSF